MNITPEALEEALRVTPGQKRDQQLAFLEAEKVFNEVKLAYEVAQAVAIKNSNAKNATEKKADAIIATEKEKKTLIDVEYNKNIEKAKYDFLSDKYISLRKIASIEIDLIKSNISGH